MRALCRWLVEKSPPRSSKAVGVTRILKVALQADIRLILYSDRISVFRFPYRDIWTLVLSFKGSEIGKVSSFPTISPTVPAPISLPTKPSPTFGEKFSLQQKSFHFRWRHRRLGTNWCSLPPMVNELSR